MSDARALTRTPRRLRALLVRLPLIASVIAIVMGAIVLVGWIADIHQLTTPLPGLPMMVANTAVMSVLAGISLGLLAGAQKLRAMRIAGKCVALVLAVFSVATVFEYVAGVELGIDQLVVSGRIGVWPIGRPSLHVASAFALIAVALLLLDRELAKHRYVAEYIALAPVAIAVTVLLGYLLEVPTLYEHPAPIPFVGMSPSTALVILAIAVGILCVHVDRGMLSILIAEDAGGVAARQLLTGLAMFPPLAVVVLFFARLGWYSPAVAGAMMLFLALAEGSIFMMSTARRLSRIDTAQRKAAGELGESEARLRAFVDESKDGIFLADYSGRCIDVNPTGCELLGYTRAELIGRRPGFAFPPEDLPRWREAVMRGYAGETIRGEWELRRRDGSSIYVEVVAHIISKQRWQAIIRDVGERKRNAQALAQAYEAEQRARADLEAVDAGRAALSEAVASLRGAQIEPVLAQIAEQARVLTSAEYAAVGLVGEPGQPFEHFVSAGMPPHVSEAIGRRPRSVGTLGYVLHHPWPLRVREISSHPSFLGLPRHHPLIGSFLSVPIRRGDRVIGSLYIGNKLDTDEFTERDERVVSMLSDGAALAIETARSYAAGSAHRTWLRRIVDQLPEGIIVVDADEHVQAINLAMKQWTYDPSVTDVDAWANPALFDVRDKNGDLIPFEELGIVRALRTGEPTPHQEGLLHLADGRMVPVESTAVPVHDEVGRRAGAIVVTRDITERKETERLREEWIAVVAHDLRQPMTAIVCAVDILYERLAPAREGYILENLRSATCRLTRMVDDLLDDARISANRLTVDRGHVELSGVVTRAVDQIRIAHPAVHIAIDAPAECFASIDEQRIEQVLANLLSNAVKYRCPETPIHVEVVAGETEVKVGVHNRGAAIEPDEAAQLFNRFHRTRAAREGGKPGLGLGLYVSKGLIEAHGGRMWLESDAGWTKFYFTVPAAVRPAQTPG